MDQCKSQGSHMGRLKEFCHLTISYVKVPISMCTFVSESFYIPFVMRILFLKFQGLNIIAIIPLCVMSENNQNPLDYSHRTS